MGGTVRVRVRVRVRAEVAVFIACSFVSSLILGDRILKTGPK